MEQELFDRLTHFWEDSGQSKKVGIERAAATYIKDYYDRQTKLETIVKRD